MIIKYNFIFERKKKLLLRKDIFDWPISESEAKVMQ